MTNEGRDEVDGMDARDDQALWALLGRENPTHKAGPYFSRRVLREVTLAEEGQRAGWWKRIGNLLPGSLFGRRAALCSGVASGVCAILLLVLVHGGRTRGRTEAVMRGEAAAAPSVPPQVSLATVPSVAPAPSNVVAGDGQAQDDEVIADLDNALQREESRAWTEDTARF